MIKKKIAKEIKNKNYFKAISLIQKATNEKGEDPELLYNFGICCFKLDNIEKSIEVFIGLNEKYPKYSEFSQSNKLIILSLIKLKKYQEALELIQKRLLIEVDDVILLSFQAYSFEKLKQISDSIRIHQKILKVQPTNKNSLNSIAYLLLSKNQILENEWKLIQICLDNLMKLDPTHYAYLDSYGFYLFRKGQKKEALDHFQLALSFRPNDHIILEHLQSCL